MSDHIVYLELNIKMEEMDGSPESSAEILLDSDTLSKVIALLSDEGYDAEFSDNVFAEET